MHERLKLIREECINESKIFSKGEINPDIDLFAIDNKVYKISDKLNRDMMRIGLMWLQEVQKPAYSFEKKKK